MKRKVFLCGEIGCGKSTLIQQVLDASVSRAGGFLTRRIEEKGLVKGFTLFPAEELLQNERQEHCFLSFSADLKTEENVFAEYVPEILYKAREFPFALLDEIGGVELLEPRFWEALQALLESETPCLGVLKTEAAARALAEKIELGEAYAAGYRKLRQLLAEDAETQICAMSGRQDAKAEETVRSWAQVYT